MKAQSELVGDHKRWAEMTHPHFGGVTNWMNGTADMKKYGTDRLSIFKDSPFSFNEDGVLTISTLVNYEKTNTGPFTVKPVGLIDDEVNYRPAAQ